MALIVKKLRDAGYNAGYYKAALSGAEKKENGLHAGDADYVNRVARIDEDMKNLVTYVYENAVSPHLAAQIEGNPVEMHVVKAMYAKGINPIYYVLGQTDFGRHLFIVIIYFK